MFQYVPTALTPEEQAKVPAPGYTPLLADELPIAIAQGARVYGYLEDTQQIVKIPSEYYLDKYSGRLSFAWMSGTTISDLIKKA